MKWIDENKKNKKRNIHQSLDVPDEMCPLQQSTAPCGSHTHTHKQLKVGGEVWNEVTARISKVPVHLTELQAGEVAGNQILH